MGKMHLVLMCVEFDKEMKPTNTPRDLKVPYKHIKLPTCIRFDHNFGYPQGGFYKGYITKFCAFHPEVF
jgi:hypothetical protein